MGYVTADMARRHLRLDDDDNTDVQLLVDAASAMVSNYLKRRPIDAPYEAPDVDTVSPPIWSATLLMTGYIYRYRDEDPGYTAGYLPAPVISMLYPLRDPACA